MVIYSWAGYDSTAWETKVFVVTNSTAGFNREVRTYARTPTDATTGTTVMTRKRSLYVTDEFGAVVSDTVKKYQVLHFSYDTADALLLTGFDDYLTDTTTLITEKTISPGINLRNNAMNVGMTWATGAKTTTTYTEYRK